ncbi:MAG: hypothetical protein U0528_04080 [Anaerolineae bacterium]
MTFAPSNLTASGEEKTFCAVHTNVETGLKCNKCGRYRCVNCAVKTPVGYRCRDCVYQQQSAFFTASSRDYVVALLVSLALNFPIAYILMRIGGGSLFLVIIASIPIGGFIGEVVNRAVGKRRGRYTYLVAAAGIIISGIIAALLSPQVQLYFSVLSSNRGPDSGEILQAILFQLLVPVIYLVLCAGTVIARLRYGR